MFNDALAEIFPTFICLLVGRLARLSVEDICSAQVWSENPCYFWPSHELVDGEKLQQLGVQWYLGITGILVYAMEKIGLLIVVRSEDDVVYDSLQDLGKLADVKKSHLLQLTE